MTRTEAGVKFVTVYFAATIGGQDSTGGWDTHGFNNKPMYPVLSNYLTPITDQTLPTLLEDLDNRGLLDDTLVLWMGEFGRSPRINNIAGRDHWPQCYTALLAGGGVRRGDCGDVAARLEGALSDPAVEGDPVVALMGHAGQVRAHIIMHVACNFTAHAFDRILLFKDGNLFFGFTLFLHVAVN